MSLSVVVVSGCCWFGFFFSFPVFFFCRWFGFFLLLFLFCLLFFVFSLLVLCVCAFLVFSVCCGFGWGWCCFFLCLPVVFLWMSCVVEFCCFGCWLVVLRPCCLVLGRVVTLSRHDQAQDNTVRVALRECNKTAGD